MKKGKEQKRKNMSQAAMIWQRFKKNKLAITGLVMLTLMILICLIGTLTIDYQTAIQQNLQDTFHKPDREHWFGTDMLGRDMFARIVHGGLTSLGCSIIVILLALFIGILFGGISGYVGGKTDIIIMRMIDIVMAIPSLLLAMILVVVMGQSKVTLILALALGIFPGLARIVRSSVLTTKGNEYVDAAKCYGASPIKILIKHVLPNCTGPVIVSTTLMLGATILSISIFGFLGIGIPSPQPEWGTILSEVRDSVRYHPYLGIIPGVAIALSVLSINFVGDGLRDALDPRTRK